jgi:Protein of unknown function (DUF3164)
MTATELPTIPDGYMMDSKRRLVPENLVKPELKLEDQLVRKLVDHGTNLSAQIARFKGHCYDDIATFLQLLGERYGGTKGGAKGNMTFTTFDGCLKVQVAVADHLEFGPELQIAKELIDGCIGEWAEGSRDEIRALVNHAFRVDKEGQVSRDAVLALRNVEIDDDRWRNAMQAITDSIRVVGSKSYIRIYRRDTPEAAWKAVTIDLASAALPAASPTTVA